MLKHYKHLVRIAKWIFIPLAFSFIIYSIWQTRFILQDLLAHSSYMYLLWAMLVYTFANLLIPFIGIVILQAEGINVSYKKILNIHFQYLPARYLPGGIWFTVARVHRLHQLGVTTKYLTGFILLEHILALSMSLILGGGIVSSFQETGFWYLITSILMIISVGVLLILPTVMWYWLFNKKTVLNIGYYIFSISLVCLFWVCMASAFILFLSAFPGIFDTFIWWEMAGIYLFSWGIGFLAVFAPQGIGVFEAVAAELVTSNLSFINIVSLLVGFRFLIIISDLILWILGGSITHFYKGTSKS